MTTHRETVTKEQKYKGTIENFVGYTSIPTGMIDEIIVHNQDRTIKTKLPLATTEGALVASYNRGCKVINLSGGVTSHCVDQGVQRVPIFVFDRMSDAHDFMIWIEDVKHLFSNIVMTKTNHGKLKSINSVIEGNVVNIEFLYTTGDAAGQNMVTFCTDAICEYIISKSPVKIKKWMIDGNLSGDKKVTSQYLKGVRGRKVCTDIVIPKDIVISHLKSTPKAMVEFWQHAIVNQVMSSAASANGHLVNGLTAIYLATGQDVACAAESSVGISRFNLTDEGDLYVALTLPSLIVGTVGGGTKMDYAQANLAMMDCLGEGSANRFAEIIGGLLLAGEISIAAALASNHFTSAHLALGR